MNILESLNRGLEERYGLDESKIEQDAFKLKFGNNLYDRFVKLHKRLNPPENDFTYWTGKKNNKTKEELEKVLSNIELSSSKTQDKKKAKEGGRKIYDGQGWVIYEVNTYEASVYYGRDTKWCITGVYDNPDDEETMTGSEYFNYYQGLDDDGEPLDAEEYGLYDTGQLGAVQNYYFLWKKTDEKHKWCYMNYVCFDDEAFDLNSMTLFFDATDNEYGFYDLDKIEQAIPREVLLQLPNMLEIYAAYKAIDCHGTFYYNRENILDVECARNMIKEIVVSKKVKELSYGEFFNWWGVKKITFEPQSTIQEIPEYIFYNCMDLESITLPVSVKKICKDAFKGLQSLREINIDGEYRPQIFNKQCGLEDKVKINWTDCDKTETWGKTELIITEGLTSHGKPYTRKFIYQRNKIGDRLEKLN